MFDIAILESDPVARRVYGVIFRDDGVTIATDAHLSAPPHSFRVSINGAAPIDAGGNFVGNGLGEYYYEFSLSEVALPGFLMFGIKRTGYLTTWFPVVYVDNVWTVGETNPVKLRAPVVIYDNASPPALVTSGAAPAAGELQTALNNVTFANAAGSLVFVADGLHYYQGTAANASAKGMLLVRFSKAGFQSPQDITVPIEDAPGFVAPLAPPPSGTSSSGLSFVPSGFQLAQLSPTPSTIAGGLDRLIDPDTGDFVRTADGQWAETQDSRTIFLIRMNVHLGKSPFNPQHGTAIAERKALGLPLTPEFLQAETVRVGTELTNEGVLTDMVVVVRDAQGRPLRNKAGRQVVQVQYRDLSSGSPVDQTFTPR